MHWDEYFMSIARAVALKSKDLTKVGVVIVGPDKEIRSTGYNGFPRGILDGASSTRWERPEKYEWIEHAERNAIYNAARCGARTKDCMMVTLGPPCTPCARAIIQAGITEVVLTTKNPFAGRPDWKASLEFAEAMLEEAGVEVRWTDL